MSSNKHKEQGDIQKRLEGFLPGWYPNFHQPLGCVFIQKKTFRWSEHLIFQILERDAPCRKILVKLPRVLSKGNRQQNIDLPSEGRSRLEYQALASLHEYFYDGKVQGINAVRPLAYFSDIDALVLEYLPGENFLNILKKAGIFFGMFSDHALAHKVAFDAGRLLAYLHQISYSSLPITKSVDEFYLAQNLENKKDRLLALDPSGQTEKQILYMNSLITEYLSKTHIDVQITKLHGDYYPENIVRLPSGSVFTVDTILNQIGPMEQDIIKFLVGTEITKQHVLFGSFGVDKRVAKGINQDFLNGYQSIRDINQNTLIAFWGLGLIQRWIEMLEVLESHLPSLWDSFLVKARIRFFMLRRMESLQKALEKEISLYE